jgi:hypothetical protein
VVGLSDGGLGICQTSRPVVCTFDNFSRFARIALISAGGVECSLWPLFGHSNV